MASPLENSSRAFEKYGALARSRIPPATQAMSMSSQIVFITKFRGLFKERIDYTVYDYELQSKL